LRAVRKQDAARDARTCEGVCAVRTFEGCRRTDGIGFIREDDMFFFVIGFVVVMVVRRFPVEIWIGLSLGEGLIELVFTISTAVLTAPK